MFSLCLLLFAKKASAWFCMWFCCTVFGTLWISNTGQIYFFLTGKCGTSSPPVEIFYFNPNLRRLFWNRWSFTESTPGKKCRCMLPERDKTEAHYMTPFPLPPPSHTYSTIPSSDPLFQKSRQWNGNTLPLAAPAFAFSVVLHVR